MNSMLKTIENDLEILTADNVVGSVVNSILRGSFAVSLFKI